MRVKLTFGLMLLGLVAAPLVGAESAVDGRLAVYRAQGAAEFSASAGARRWDAAVADAKSGEARRCSGCHTGDLKHAGKHVTTGKSIEPMAPSVNPQRLTDAAKIEKWFTRNCRWTYGRACTAQEKGDFLVFLQSR
jgi:hypothetical protein